MMTDSHRRARLHRATARIPGWATVTICLAGAAAALAEPAAPKPLDSGIRPGEVEKRRYLDYARECIDVLIARGTDRYGTVHSPMLMSILDVRSRDCPADPPRLDEAWRVTRRGRRNPGGGNLYHDQATLAAMCELTRLTGQPRYAEFARRCANHTMTQLVDERGLFWWGYHRHYDAHRDVRTGHSGNHHEIHIQQIAWGVLWRANPAAVRREIEAIWRWHVIDKKTGEVNRHADGRRGCDFAMSAGEILLAFAFLHTKTPPAESPWLDRARLVAGWHARHRHPKTGLIPNRPNAGAGRFDGAHFDTSITGLYCVRLLEAHELTGEASFRDQAVGYLQAYAHYGWDAAAGQFWGSLKLDGTPVPGPRTTGGYQAYEPRGHVDLWQPYIAGYEHPLATAQAYAYAAERTGSATLLAAARKWAACIRAAFPPRRALTKSWYAGYASHYAPHGTHAGNYGRVISFFLHLGRLTGETAQVDFARAVAREAVAKLYYRGLLRGHPAKAYYEAADDVALLLRALIQLDQTLTGPDKAKVSCKNW